MDVKTYLVEEYDNIPINQAFEIKMDNMIYEDINDQFGYAKYLNFDVIIMKSNQYINISKLCVENNKDFCDWIQSKRAKIVIKAFEEEYNIKPLMQILDVPNELRGTYIHRYLMSEIGSWISTNFLKELNNLTIKYEQEMKKPLACAYMSHEGSEETNQKELKIEEIEDINNQFGRAKYLNLNVIIMKSNRYINISKLCVENNKDFCDWTRSKRAKIIIKAFKEEYKIEPLMQVLNVQNELRGTYIHHYLMSEIGSWVSTKFLFRLGRILDEYVTREYK